MSHVVWTCVKVVPVIGGIAFPGQTSNPQVQIQSITFPVDGDISPEQAAMTIGLLPAAYIRPATAAERRNFYVEHPELDIGGPIPDVFNRA